MIKYELSQRGVDDKVIYEVFENMDLDEISGAVKLIRKKIKDFSNVDFKEKQKVFAMLQRKGYNYDVIKEAFDEASSDDF